MLFHDKNLSFVPQKKQELRLPVVNNFYEEKNWHSDLFIEEIES